MTRRAHYWRPAKRTSCPANIVAFDTEGRAAEPVEGQGQPRQLWRLGCAIGYRLEGGRRTRIARHRAVTPASLLAFIVGRLGKRKPLWIIAHNLPFDLKLGGLWGTLTSERFQCSHCAMSPGSTFIKGKLDGKAVVLADTFNWWKCPLAEVGQELGMLKMPMPAPDDDDRAWSDYCMRDVEVCAAAFDAAIQFVREHDLGPWAATVAGQAFSALKCRFLKHRVLVHDDDRVLKLERQAYYGGIVETSYVGSVREHGVTELDVQSMYPACCRGELPVRLAGYSAGIGPEALRTLSDQYAICADVLVRSERETYPCRDGLRVIYPTGEYRTALPDPELREALRQGHVAKVYAASWYHKAPVLRECMEYLLALRRSDGLKDKPAQRMLCKALANSLYGKVGQKNIRWERWGEEALRRIEELNGLAPGSLAHRYHRPPRLLAMEETYLCGEARTRLKLRDYWGFTEVQVDWGESRDSVPIMAACVTSEARLLLREYQRLAGPRHWYYSDTDSLWVDAVGLMRLHECGAVVPGEPGKLSVRREASKLIIRAPKDYTVDGARVVKGAKSSATWDGEDCYEQDQFPGSSSMLRDVANPGVLIQRVRRKLRRCLDRCTVLPDGWTVPLDVLITGKIRRIGIDG